MSKTFIITGASTGIGNATAKILLKKRYKVIGLSRKKSIFHKNYKHIFFDAGVENLETEINNKISMNENIDGLVNNLGSNIPQSFMDIDEKSFDKVISINLKFPFFLTQKLNKKLKKKASIVNISSFSAISGGPISSHYAIAKAGIETMTKNLAIFFKDKKVRVNAISPGLIKTKLAKFPQKHPYFNRILLNRAGKKEEIAHLICFLLSEESSYINGQTINADGGMFLK
jgi:3-oxoacyl-[acyl-carrier protein] reductase